MRRQYLYVDKPSASASTAVGVLDKAVAILSILATGPKSLAELVEQTGVARPTAHRLAVALVGHGLAARNGEGRFELGPRLRELAAGSAPDPLLAAAGAVLADLREGTGESAQLYRRRGSSRVCVATAERASGLRDTVPLGAVLSLAAGSAAQVLLAWEPPARVAELLRQARFTARELATVRRRGWAATVAEREPGLASVSAPVRDRSGAVIAAVCLSGPVERLGRAPGARHAATVVTAAAKLSASIGGAPVSAAAAATSSPARRAGHSR